MKEVRIAIVGAGWMGRAHSTAFRSVPMVFGTYTYAMPAERKCR